MIDRGMVEETMFCNHSSVNHSSVKIFSLVTLIIHFISDRKLTSIEDLRQEQTETGRLRHSVAAALAGRLQNGPAFAL
jgi:hypothetical protein